jgi:hypothetical protein
MAGAGAPDDPPSGPGRLATVLLLVPGLVLFGLFLVPTGSALTNGPALLIDSLLRVLAVAALASVPVIVFAETAVAARTAVVASALCLLVGISVLFSGLWTPFRDWWAMAGAAIACATAALSLYQLRDAWSHIKITTSRVVGAVLTTAAVPAFTFWSQTSFLPSRNASSLEMSTAAALQTGPDGAQHWVITSTVHNLSDVRAFVIISGLTACRWSDESHWQRDIEPDNKPAEHCEALTAPFNERSWLDPDATLTTSTPVGIDTGLPLLQVSLRVAYARADRVIEALDSRRDATTGELGKCAEAKVWNLQPQSRLASLARRELAMMYADVDGDGGETYFFGAADSMHCARRPDDPRLNQTRFQDLNQYLSLTEATRVWVSWPAAPKTDAAGN